MAFHRLPLLKRTLCCSFIIKHSILRLIVPSSFITICVLLFLKIQQFGDHKNNSGFIPKSPEANLWDEIVKSGVTITNPEMFKRAVLMMREDSLNPSAKLRHFESLPRNHSIDSGNRDQERSRQSISSTTVSGSSRVSPKPKAQPVFAVIFVISRPDNVLLRLAARKTWAMEAEMYRILVQFVVGRQENWSDIVDRESSMHNDLIIFEEDDIEEVLPNKVIKGFEWALELSPTPVYFMKIDDDTIVNVPYLAKELLKHTTVGPLQIVGSVRENVPVVRDLQNNKWAVSILDYPSSTYPTYVFGGGYVMRAQTAKALLEKRYYTYSWVHLEDVYLTGFVAAKAGVSHKHHQGFSSWDSDKVTACDFVLNRRFNSINNTEQEFYELYKGVNFLLRSKNKNYCT